MNYFSPKLKTQSAIMAKFEERNKIAHVKANESADSIPGAPEAIMDALFALKSPPAEACLATAILARRIHANVITTGLAKALRTSGALGCYLVRVTPEHLHSPGHHVVLDLLELRKCSSVMKKCEVPNLIGFSGLQHRPADNEVNFETYLKWNGIVYGDALTIDKMLSAQRAINQRFPAAAGAQVMKFQNIELDPRHLAAAAATICDMADVYANGANAIEGAKKLGIKKWKSTRPLREFLRMQALSSISWKSLAVVHGDGRRIFERAMVDAKHALKQLAKASDLVIHRDQIQQHHAAELHRLGLANYHLPFLKTR